MTFPSKTIPLARMFSCAVMGCHGSFNGIRRAVHAPPGSHPHKASGSLKVQKVVFHHQAVAAHAGHDMVSLL